MTLSELKNKQHFIIIDDFNYDAKPKTFNEMMKILFSAWVYETTCGYTNDNIQDFIKNNFTIYKQII